MKLLGSTVQDHHVLSRAEGTAHKGEEAATDQRILSRSNIFGAWFYFFQRDPDRSGVLIINTYNIYIYINYIIYVYLIICIYIYIYRSIQIQLYIYI